MIFYDDEDNDMIAIMNKLNKPVKADLSILKKMDDSWIAEPKLDGTRCLLVKQDGMVALVREGGTVKTSQYPEIINAADDLPDNTILDGELCILESPLRANFNLILKRETIDNTKIKLLSQRIPATFVAFDCLAINDYDIHQNDLFHRRAHLETVKTNDRIKVITQYKPSMIAPVISQESMEGIVLKNMRSSYDQKWFKIKNLVEHDFTIIGYTSEKRPITALELADADGNYVGKVNYNPKLFRQDKKIKDILKGATAVVEYLPSPGKLRFPVLKDIRFK